MARYRLVVLSLATYTKRRFVLLRVVMMTHCRLTQMEELAYWCMDARGNEPNDNTIRSQPDNRKWRHRAER
jgi:hypothetical protein